MAEEIAVPETGRNLRELTRYVVGIAIGLLVLLLAGRHAEPLAAWHQLRRRELGGGRGSRRDRLALAVRLAAAPGAAGCQDR